MKKNIIIFTFILSMFNSCTLLPFLSPEEKAEGIQLLQQKKALDEQSTMIKEQILIPLETKIEKNRKDAEILRKNLLRKFAAEPQEKLWIDKALFAMNGVFAIGNAILKEMNIDFMFPVAQSIQDISDNFKNLFRGLKIEASKLHAISEKLINKLSQNKELLKEMQEFEPKWLQLKSRVETSAEMKVLNNEVNQLLEDYNEALKGISEKYGEVDKKMDSLFNNIIAKYPNNNLVQEYRNIQQKISQIETAHEFSGNDVQKEAKLERELFYLIKKRQELKEKLKEKILRGGK